MQNPKLDEAQARIKIARRNINTSDMLMTPPLWQKAKRNYRASWGKWKRRMKSQLKTQHSTNRDHGIQSHHFMENRWGNNGNSERLYLGGSKFTADGDCSHEIKRRLLFGRKAMTNLESILQSRDITLLTNACLVKAMVFPVVMDGCESWTIKKAEHWRNDTLNCGVGEDSWESLGLQGDQTSQS